MIKKYSLFLIVTLCFVLSGFGQGSESFDNLNASGSGYGNDTYTGDNGVSWTYNGARLVNSTYNITGISIGFGTSGTRNVSASSGINGVGDVEYSIRSYFTGGTAADRTIEVYVNGNLYDNYTLAAMTNIYTRTINANENGDVIIEFRSTGSRQIVLDDVSWTSATTGPTVTYDGNGNSAGTVPTDSGPYTSGATVTVLGNTGSLTQTCGTFNNWNTVANGSGTPYSAGNTFTITADTTLYAQWTSTANTVTFNNNGGTGTMTPQMDCTFANLTNNTFTNIGFTFNSWNTAADGTGTTYGDGDPYGFSTNLTLYAQWDVYVGPCLSDNFDSGYGNWSGGSGTYNSSTAGNTGDGIGFNTNNDDIITASSLTNPSSISFIARASGSGSDFTINIQYSTLVSGPWTTATSIVANGSNSGDITDVFNNFNLPLNLSGPYFLRILQSPRSGGSFYLDDVEVYCGPPCITPANPSGVISSIDAPDFCETAELAFSGSAPTDIVYYWQTDANGIDTTNDTANALDVTTDGDFYVRAYNTVTSCWSAGVVGPFTVTISNLPEIINQPDNINVANGGNATFSATVTGAASYQWQVSIDGGSTWANTGTNSNTLNVLGVNISMHGYIYRIVATNSCGDTVSDEAILFVHSGSPCIEEDFNSFPDSGWTDSGTIIETTGVHSGASQPCRVFGTNDAIVTSQTDYPTILEFYQDASSSGDGNTATVDYRIGTGAWTPLHSFTVTQTGRTELVDLTDVSGVNLASQANVRFRFNSTFNSWYLDDVKVYCTPCAPPTTTTSIDLSSGPIGTYVTISGSQLGTATVSINSIALTPISQNANEIVIQIPNNAVDGSIIIETNSIVCDTAFPFDVIDQELSCQTNISPPPTDLFIYELFDEDQNIDGSGGAWGNGGMITIFNGTLETKDLSEYRLYRSTDFTDTGNNPYSLWHSPSGTLAPGEVYRIWIDGSNCSDYATPYETEFIGFNANDGVELRKDNGSGSYITIDQLHTANIVGYHYVRDLSVSNPNATYNFTEWSFTDIFPSSPYCVGAGQAPNFEGGSPTILLDVPITSCSTFEITANATEGYTGIFAPDSYNLTYQWFYFDGINDMWNPLNTGGDYTVINSTSQSILTIDNILTKTNYQFYCEVSEGSGCYTASEAIKIELNKTTWDGTDWTNSTAPDEFTVAIIDGLYDTTLHGDIDACQLIVNSGVNRTLNVTDSHYVRVVNSVTNNGTITVQTHGSFVQDGLGVAGSGTSGTFTNNGSASVIKYTDILNDWYEYTYWSSPVVSQSLNTATPDTPNSRRFYFETANYLDQHTDGTANGIPDDIDDDGNDWQNASGDIMELGRGYATTSSPLGSFPGVDQTVFDGAFFTGDLLKPIITNGFSGDNDWNFVGNPYASAIAFNDLHTENISIIDGAAYLWSQARPPLITNPGNEVLNFNQADYAIITVGSGNTAGGSTVIPAPGNFIPSGQGFFVKAINSGGDLKFTNDMRRADNSSNNQFFRTGNSNQDASTVQTNRLWVNLTSDNGVFNQILVAYVTGATDGDDGWSYDAPRNLSSGLASVIYTSIEDVANTRYAIQGKAPSSLSIDEIIPVGFITNISESTIYTLSIAQLEGEYFNENTIYLKDNMMNIIHDLSSNDYSFTSESGDFNDRFEIVFRDSFLSINEEEISANNVTIIELQNGVVQFTVPNQYEIKSVEIIDLLGRIIYKLKGQSSTETYNLSNLSKATYIAKITLTNGQVISKKAVKRK